MQNQIQNTTAPSTFAAALQRRGSSSPADIESFARSSTFQRILDVFLANPGMKLDDLIVALDLERGLQDSRFPGFSGQDLMRFIGAVQYGPADITKVSDVCEFEDTLTKGVFHHQYRSCGLLVDEIVGGRGCSMTTLESPARG